MTATDRDKTVRRDLERLRQHLLALAPEPGRSFSHSPDVTVFRADAPQPLTRLHTPGIVVAAIASRRKTIHFADGRTVSYAPGSYLFMTREAQYSSHIAAASKRSPYLSLGVLLPSELVAETVLALDDLDDDGSEDVDGFVAPLGEPLLDAFVRLAAAVREPVDAQLVAPLIVRELIVRLLRTEVAGPLRRAARTDDGRIREAMRFIRERVHERLSVARIAKHVAMSPSHFAHRFRAVARMSPMRYAKQQRLAHARVLLLRDGLRIAEAAGEVGYASAAQFSRDFKATFGDPPRVYVERFR